MNIIPPKQEFWNTLPKKIYTLPLILSDGESCLYLLIQDVNKDLEDFILTGKAHTSEFHVLSAEQESALTDCWNRLGLTVTYNSQKIEVRPEMLLSKAA